MIEERLQLWLDQALATCRQRWLMGAVAVASIAAATLLGTVGTASASGVAVFTIFTTGFAVVAVAGSGTHHGSIVIALVAMTWLLFVDDVTTPRSIGVAACLHTFHALLALMAATRHTSPVDHRILVRWGLRSIAVLAATVGVWIGVVGFEGRDLNGSATLTLVAVVVVAAGAVALRRQILWRAAS